jgi:choline dehydrogenase-like flavoprotein
MKMPHENHQHYQLAVIGSGSGGREATLLAARKGLRTVLIEGGKVGGASFHSGCYAVRALQACAHQFRNHLTSGRFGNHIDLLKTTLEDWMMAQQKVSSRLTDAFSCGIERAPRRLDRRVRRVLGRSSYSSDRSGRFKNNPDRRQRDRCHGVQTRFSCQREARSGE